VPAGAMRHNAVRYDLHARVPGHPAAVLSGVAGAPQYLLRVVLIACVVAFISFLSPSTFLSYIVLLLKRRSPQHGPFSLTSTSWLVMLVAFCRPGRAQPRALSPAGRV
jgi:hypothetical protein